MSPPSTNTAVPAGTRRRSRKQAIRDLAEANGWTVIGEKEWEEICAQIPRVKAVDLRESGVPALPPWAGVNQNTLKNLERSLIEIGAVYESSPELRMLCRKVVIEAKDLARYVSEKQPSKAEMVEWMLVWLSDPSLFSTWVRLRKQIIGSD